MDSQKSKSKKTKKVPATRRKPANASCLAQGEWFEKLVDLQARIRVPSGCRWVHEQTNARLRTFILEETYEDLYALDHSDDANLAEELGDLLLQIVFHEQIAREEKRFDVADVVREIHEKMVRRHPHVFGKVRTRNAA